MFKKFLGKLKVISIFTLVATIASAFVIFQQVQELGVIIGALCTGLMYYCFETQ
jgi:hypothetical protein